MGRGDLGGGQRPFHWAEGTAGVVALGGLRQTNLVRKERLGVWGAGGGRQAGVVHRTRGEGEWEIRLHKGGTRVVMKALAPSSGWRSLFWGAGIKEE